MDEEVQETVEALLGGSVKVVDCEKKSSIKGEEVLLVNGCPIPLDDDDGLAIREALLHGNVPDCDVLNHILLRAGILNSPVKLETSLSVKSSVVTTKEITVSRGGEMIDGYSKERKEDNLYASETSEIWQPRGLPHRNKHAVAAIPQSFASFSLPSSACEFRLLNSQVPNRHAATELQSKMFHRGSSDTMRNNASYSTFNSDSKLSVLSGSFSDNLQDTEEFHRSNCPRSSGNHFENNTRDSVFSSCICGPSKQLLQQANNNIKKINNQVSDKFLVYRDTNLVAGDFGSLLQHLVPTLQYYPNRSYCFTFLLTYRLFISPFDLLASFIAICDSQQNIKTDSIGNSQIIHYIKRLIVIIKEWCELFPNDFQDEYLMTYLQSVLCKCITIDQSLKDEVNIILMVLMQNIRNMNAHELYISNVTYTSTIECPTFLDTLDLVELCPDPRILAENLCHIELEYLSYIRPEELVQIFSKDMPLVEDSYNIRSQNLKAYIEWFNRLSFVVSTEICKQTHKKRRVKVVEYWIEVARESFNIGNFNSLMSIISGLNTSSVMRLKRTWNKVQSAKFNVLEHQMDPTSNFSSYRSTLKAAVWRSASGRDKKQQIVIPFFSLLIKDIYFLNECCVSKLPNGRVNFEKFWQLGRQITEFMKWKQVVCPFTKCKNIISYLQGAPILSENGLALASFACEQPDGSVEKDRYKLLNSGSSVTNQSIDTSKATDSSLSGQL